jgi:hypothetical protein
VSALVPTLAVALALALAGPAAAQPRAAAADSAAIRALVHDYALGWYDGEPARMERALHPRLAKRSVVRDAAGRAALAEMPAQRLIDEARSGVGRRIPADVRRVDVRILDVYGDIASVRADMHGWVDYFQVARMDGAWKVVNVLWALHPQDAAAPTRVVRP